jgi:hypothetical protein
MMMSGPVILVLLALATGVWFVLSPRHVMYSLNTLFLTIISRYSSNTSSLQDELQKARRLLSQNPEQLRSNFRFVRFTGIVILLVAISWILFFIGSAT